MKDAYYIRWRFNAVLIVILLAIVGLAFRVFDLTILDQNFLRHQGDERVLRLISTPANRGMIVDRNGHPLAVSTEVFAAWINPKVFTPTKQQTSQLAAILGMKPKELTLTLQRNGKAKKEFAYLKRGLSPEEAQATQALELEGLHIKKEFHRFYPEGEVTAHILGFTNIDDQGQEGLELAYDHYLEGEPGKRYVIKDRLGRIISEVKKVQDQTPGQDLALSIDRRIQYVAYRELAQAVAEHQALAGTAIVLDANTGEVLAMVNQPSFNPNSRIKDKNSLRNRAVTDVFEPGSTIKAFTVASALDSGRYKPHTVIDTSPGWMRVGRNVVKDEENHGPMTVTEIMEISSNMGVTKMVLGLSPNQLWSLLHRVGFGEMTGIEYPGEQNGLLVQHHPWGEFMLATLGFGYGLSVTPIQLARAYGVLANDGVKLPVTILKQDKQQTGERVMKPKIAKDMLAMLESVVTSQVGTGKLARIPGYRVAGKTGTALKVGEHGYEKRRYRSSFVGIAPASKPRIVVAVIIDEPHGKQYYGGSVAAPAFKTIMENTLRILNIPPDRLENEHAA